MTNTEVIALLFRAAGVATPARGTRAWSLLLEQKDPPRAVAWYVLARQSGQWSPQRLTDGLLLLAKGWGDVRLVRHLTRGATLVTGNMRGSRQETVEIRPSSSGKWGKAVEWRSVDGTRESRELATAWLARALRTPIEDWPHDEGWKAVYGDALLEALASEEKGGDVS